MRLAACAAVAALATAIAALLPPAARAQTPAPAAADPPPVEAFFGRASFESAVLSPSGRWLAWVAAVPGRRNALVVHELDGATARRLAAFVDVDIAGVHWLSDERLVFDVTEGDTAVGDRRGNFSLFTVKRDGAELKQLVRFSHGSRDSLGTNIVDRQLSNLHQLVHVPEGGKEVVVVEWRHTTDEGWHRAVLKRLDVETGIATSLSLNMPTPFEQVLFDPDGSPRLVTTRKAGTVRVHWRDRESGKWREIAAHPMQRRPWVPWQLAADGLYVALHGGKAGEAQLAKYDFDRGAPVEPPLVSTPGFDFRGGIVAETPGGPALGVRTTTDAETTVWFDPALRAAQETIDQRLPGRINRLRCSRCGRPDMAVLVVSWSDREPGELYVWRAARDGRPETWARVGRRRDAIDPARMGTLDLHRIRARDGRDLPVWVTQPAGAKVGDPPRPAVVLVHGGPWVRGVDWRWDAWAQFLASRGYVVVEPEFRGSAGYGQAHLAAGIRQWGLAMQDDVADAARWAAKNAGVDPARVCIAGGSYGGYSTLMGLVRDADLYRCGVAWAAVTEPRLVFKWSWSSDATDETRNYSLPALLGDPAADVARFDETSPLVQAARIRAPLLLAFGGEDRRVPIEHGERLRDALTAAGRPPQWVLYPAEGHGWMKHENRYDFARRVERFLAEQLR